jgi:hypothetical protein
VRVEDFGTLKRIKDFSVPRTNDWETEVMGSVMLQLGQGFEGEVGGEVINGILGAGAIALFCW